MRETKLKHLLIGGVTGVLLLPQILLGADDNVVFKSSFEDDLKSAKDVKVTFVKDAKISSDDAIHEKKSLDLPEANRQAALRIKGLNVNWKQGAIGFSFKLRKIEWRIFLCIDAQQTDQPAKLGFSISSDGRYFLFSGGKGKRAYFRHADILKADVWHRAVFSWKASADGSALIRCYIDGKAASKKGIVLKNFIPENFTTANPAKMILGQYNSLSGPKGFNGYFDALIIYNTTHTP